MMKYKRIIVITIVLISLLSGCSNRKNESREGVIDSTANSNIEMETGVHEDIRTNDAELDSQEKAGSIEQNENKMKNQSNDEVDEITGSDVNSGEMESTNKHAEPMSEEDIGEWVY